MSVVGNADDSVVVTVRGNLDIDSGTTLITTLNQVLDRPSPRIVVDLSGVEFCDSTGLSALIVGHKRASAGGGWLRLAAPGEFLGRLLDTVGLTPRLAIYPTVGDALVGRDAD
ncbi:STAS domain-containing protein [Paractinoplanes abujensis]|uniref:Anti-sigma factor antagonist n=1 Tax=Paractinoplanes abujensis TaxID=882441 RepID=A0A7W7CNU5_9ACTN|nr:STAS domain-containing protein [Actinoplanes abujensis]MBB4690530.1 anti-anti-sigma factor [Actinoplanes abujensis]